LWLNWRTDAKGLTAPKEEERLAGEDGSLGGRNILVGHVKEVLDPRFGLEVEWPMARNLATTARRSIEKFAVSR
jgi:hypothetical protein